jgi:hypothetical protein
MESIEIHGQEFALGCKPREAAEGSVRPCLEEAIPIIPQSKWQPVDFSYLVPAIGLQGKHSSCVGHQCTDGLETVRNLQGLYGNLSPWDLYSQVCGGEDKGALIHEAVKALHDRGVCRLVTCPDFTLNPQGTERDTEAREYQLLESYDCPDRSSIATAVQRRFPAPLGIAVYANFQNLEEVEGYVCVPRPAGRMRGGHCVLGCGLRQIGGKWRVKIATKSWGESFGDKGCAWYVLDWIDQQTADGWALRSATYKEMP